MDDEDAPPPGPAATDGEGGGEVGADDDVAAEAAALADALEGELAALEAALGRLEAGTYGRCEVCGAPLEDGVLEADPAAARCPGHPPG